MNRASRNIVAPLCALLLSACGGGAGEASTTFEMTNFEDLSVQTPLTPNSSLNSSSTRATALALRRAIPQVATDALGDSVSIQAAMLSAADLHVLANPTGDPMAGMRAVAVTSLCHEGFVPPLDLKRTAPEALPRAGTGAFFNALELATWRARIKSGPFINDADYAPGSPGDWSRIQANAARFVAQGEALANDDDASRARHGNLARDAAFMHLLSPDTVALAAVRGYLLAQVADGRNDFATQRCYRAMDNSARDGWFAEAPWVLRLAATYDFVRASLSANDRLTIENYLRRNAWFFATHLDWGLRSVFPQRLQGDYSLRGEDAATTGDAVWYSRPVDSNGDCTIDAKDDAKAWPRYAYARADGSLGPRVSWLTHWFNNRRAANALAFGTVGVMLGDGELVQRAKRYFMEWLTFAVWSDGATGEYSRNGEYCIARQGLIYSAISVQGSVMLARVLARQGDRTLASFTTRDGLYGTEASAALGGGGGAKSISLVANTYLSLISGELLWYQAEPERAVQLPRAQTDLTSVKVRYMGGASARYDLHELSMLASAAIVPTVPVAKVMLQHKAITEAVAPGQVRDAVDTGLGTWSDPLGVLPAAYLLRP